MRVYFTFSRVALVLAVVWMAMGMPAGAYAKDSASGSPQVVIAEPTTPANLLNFTEYYETADTQTPAAKEAAPAAEGNCCQGCGGCACDCCCCCCDPGQEWYANVEFQRMYGYTSYQFGTGPGGPQFAPLSKLNYSLDSDWIGLKVGLLRNDWDVHFEWLTPMMRQIDGVESDYDWSGPNRAAASLSKSSERWNDGQKLELEADYKYSDCILNMPIEVWPLAGFRFQRFDMTAYNGVQIINDRTIPNLPNPGDTFPGDGLTLNQQYYMGYIGAQLRRTIESRSGRLIDLLFQFDYGGVGGYNVDHHLRRSGGDRFTMESTGGDEFHVALVCDIPLSDRLNLGLQADYTRIRTTGSHHLIWNSQNIDETWDNGVLVKSEQTALTAYLQYVW
ncbi:MAG: omptin family outer membrane protease [Thermoguttaceae bacterium]